MIKSELKPHQWELYNLIKNATLMNKTLTVEQICEAMPDVYKLNKKECNYSNCPQLYKDIDIINLSPKIEKWIHKGGNKIRLATEEECRKDLIKLTKELSRVGKAKYRLEKKMKLNKQCKLLSNDNVPINESKARTYVETYINK